MATTAAIMKLVDKGKISLSDKVGSYFPEYRKGQKSNVTIAHLLRHDSGLPPFRIYVDELKTRKAIVERSEEHTSELQSRFDLVCRLLLDKKNRVGIR